MRLAAIHEQTLEDAVTEMRRLGVSALVVGDVEIELAPPLATTAPLAPAPSIPDALTAAVGRCACGHSIDTEHGDNGCFRGCEVGLCNSTHEAKPKQPEVAT